MVGRYVFNASIFGHLRRIERGAGGELQLTDGIGRLLREQQVLAYAYRGTRYDCGSKLGYLQAMVEYALRHPEVGADFTAWLQRRCGKLSATTGSAGSTAES